VDKIFIESFARSKAYLKTNGLRIGKAAQSGNTLAIRIMEAFKAAEFMRNIPSISVLEDLLKEWEIK
jgi:hypothetical protein